MKNKFRPFIQPLILLGLLLLPFSCCEKEYPPTLSTTEVSEITGNSAKSGGEVTDDGGATVTSRGVVWHTSENPTMDENDGKTSDGTGTGEFISELTKLNPGTKYYVRAYATNTAGTSYGDQKEFTTPGELTNEELMDLVQERTFQYFWDGAEPNSGMALERYHLDGSFLQHKVTTGGSGFGIMAIIVGIERGFITREEGVERIERILNFLSQADRFHGVWPHWMNGKTGEVEPFGSTDDGADLVETAFLVQGLLTTKQYLLDGNEYEQNLADKIDTLWREVEWDWHRRDGENVLYWHWSPNYGWEKNHQIRGYDEALIVYVLAASSPTHPIPSVVYHEGWARNGDIKTIINQYGYTLTLRHNNAEEYGGPLFWSHYSFLGLDPRNLEDEYANYWEHNVNHTLINRAYCIENPLGFEGYGEDCWGLTSSYSIIKYEEHAPGNDKGVITPTAALSSFPYTPEYSMQAMRYFYEELGDRLWGKYGFYDAFSLSENWFPEKYLAIDQGPIVVMMENHRTGLLWDLFMKNPEIGEGLEKLGFH